MDKILIADDSLGVRKLLQSQIESMGHQAFLAMDGEEAWTMIQEQPFDLVVLDQYMPNLDGVEVLKRIRSEPRLRRMPVVFFTSEEKLTEKERIFALGVHDYLVKSISSEEFEMRISAILKREESLRVEIDANLREIFRCSFRNYKNLPEMFAEVLPAIANLMQMDSVVEGKINEENYTIEYCFDMEDRLQSGQSFPLSEIYCRNVVETCTPLFIADAAKDNEWKDHPTYSRMGIRSYIGIPIFINGDIYGTLNATSKHPRKLDDFQIELMQLFALRISHEIEREMMQAKIVSAQNALIEARSLSSMSLMTASIAHEIRQPLAAADMDMAGLIDDLTEGNLKELASAARSRIKEALLTIRAMMKVYRSGKQGRQVEVDINHELRDMILLFGRKTQGVKVIYDFSEDAQVLTCGNLNRIFLNLIGNALDALQNQGQIKLTTRPSGKNMLVKVEDNGPGIPLEIIRRVFEPEFTTKKTGEGTGLGLWIAKQEVERMGGTISVESKINRFTRFTVSIPHNDTYSKKLTSQDR